MERYHVSSRCSRNTFSDSYITKYTSILVYEAKNNTFKLSMCPHAGPCDALWKSTPPRNSRLNILIPEALPTRSVPGSWVPHVRAHIQSKHIVPISRFILWCTRSWYRVPGAIPKRSERQPSAISYANTCNLKFVRLVSIKISTRLLQDYWQRSFCVTNFRELNSHITGVSRWDFMEAGVACYQSLDIAISQHKTS